MIHTHGIPIQINWGEFKPGTSFFVPGVDQRGLRRMIQAEMKLVGIPVVIRPTIEGDILGVRVWRREVDAV